MGRTLHKSVRQWFQEERLDRLDSAEQGLRRVFAQLPLPGPASGFADRVLLRVGLAPEPLLFGSISTAWAMRLALALCLILVTVTVLVTPGIVYVVFGSLKGDSLAQIGTAALVGFLQRFGEGLAVWQTFSGAGRILASTLNTPSVFAALIFGSLFSIGAFRLLHGLMITDRGTHYATTI
jgi:hypothetical protein